MIARLSGLEVANASLYDGAASLVEAANLAVAATGRPRVLCSQGVHPHWRRQLETFAAARGTRSTRCRSRGASRPGTPSSTTAASAPSSSRRPNFLGCLEDIGAARAIADRLGARLVVCFDPVSAGLLRSPGELGADVVVGEGQPFGTALGFGGPTWACSPAASPTSGACPAGSSGRRVDREGRTCLRHDAASARAGHPPGAGLLERLHEPDPDGRDCGHPAVVAGTGGLARGGPAVARGRPATPARPCARSTAWSCWRMRRCCASSPSGLL